MNVFHRNIADGFKVKSFDENDARFYKHKMTWDEFNGEYIKTLNEKNYGGFSDWLTHSRAEKLQRYLRNFQNF